MLPDLATPDTCPICASAPSHDAPKVGTLQGRVYQCGAVVCNLNEGEWEVTLYCEKTGEMLDGLRTEVSRLRADNVRLGDRNVLFAIATQAAIDDLELALRMWATRPLDLLPRETLLKLAPSVRPMTSWWMCWKAQRPRPPPKPPLSRRIMG